MASAYKILGQGQVGFGGGGLEMTVPAGKSYVVSSLTISNSGNTAIYLSNISVYAVKSGQSASTSNAILWQVPIERNTDVSFSLGITLGPGESLYGDSDTYFTPTFTAFGEEITL